MQFVTLEDSIAVFGFSNRLKGVLHRNGIRTVSQLLSTSKAGIQDLRNFGKSAKQPISKTIDDLKNGTGEFRLVDKTLLNQLNGTQLNEKRYENVSAVVTKNPTEGIPIEALNLPGRAYNCLKRARINTIEELSSWTRKDLLTIRNMGVHSVDQILESLRLFKSINNGEINSDTSLDAMPYISSNSSIFRDFRKNHILSEEEIDEVCKKLIRQEKNCEEDLLHSLFEQEAVRTNSKALLLFMIKHADFQMTESELIRLFPLKIDADHELQQLLQEMEREKKICRKSGTIEQRQPTLLEYIEGLPDDRHREIVIARLSGKTLNSVGASYGITRERTRQITNKILQNRPSLEEDSYIEFFSRYKTTCKEFCGIFSLPVESYYYLSMVCQDRKQRPLQLSLEDDELPLWIQEKIQDYFKAEYVSINGTLHLKTKTMRHHAEQLRKLAINERFVLFKSNSQLYKAIRAYCLRYEFDFDEYLQCLGYTRI